MNFSVIKIAELKPGIGFLEINRPESLNALNSTVLNELEEAVSHLNTRREWSVLVLRGAGEKAFVAGADIKEMLNFSKQDAFEFARRGQSIFSEISELPQVVIAQVQGFALGGGLELALAADFIIASRSAKFGLPEVGLGLIPGFGGTQRLVRRMGYARALEWIASAGRCSAEQSFALGLVNRIVEHQELSMEVETLAESIAAQGPSAVRSAKRAARAALAGSEACGFELEAQLFSSCFGQQEAMEGLSAFINKRKPQFMREQSGEIPQ
jgi:enoyl-CoA hydratase